MFKDKLIALRVKIKPIIGCYDFMIAFPRFKFMFSVGYHSIEHIKTELHPRSNPDDITEPHISILYRPFSKTTYGMSATKSKTTWYQYNAVECPECHTQ